MYIASLEDDPIQAQLIQQTLSEGGYKSCVFSTGKELLLALQKAEPFDLLLLDWELPDVSGEDVTLWVRANLGHQIPIMLLTNRTDEEDLVRGLNAGADDYLTKPFKATELLARINALLRRSTKNTSSEPTAITLGPYTLDPQTRLATLNGQEIQLTQKEFELAYLFFRNIGRLFSRDALSAAVWNREIPATSRTLDTHLSNIRQKLQLNPNNGMRIISSYALGYRLELLSND